MIKLGRGVDKVEKKSSQAKKSLVFQLLSHVHSDPWTVVHKAPVLDSSRQEYQSEPLLFSRGSAKSREPTHTSYIGRWISSLSQLEAPRTV